MYNRGQIHPSHHAVARKIARDIVGSSFIGHDPSPVYLSRTKLRKKFQTYIDEQSIERFCQEMGCIIVYPEKLSLKEQIILFNRHDVFIGPLGSAFHSTLFRFNGRKATNIYLVAETRNSNYEMIDSIMQNDSHIIECATSQESKRTKVFDTDKAIANLSKLLS